MIDMTFDDLPSLQNANIKVIGVGGAGGNAVNNMVRANIRNVEFIAANTDAQVLASNLASKKIHLGKTITKGLGAGGNPEVGKKAAVEDAADIEEALKGADLVFITCGCGGGTGTGAAPVVASIAKNLGALTVAVVTKPFTFEGKRRASVADAGLKVLKEQVDSYIVVPNDKIKEVADKNVSMKNALAVSDDILRQGVQGISDSINAEGLINVDFNDVKTIMGNKGLALMGIGESVGENRAAEAVKQALTSPLLSDINIKGAGSVLFNISGNEDMAFSEVELISTQIHDTIGGEANIIFGSSFDNSLDDKIRVTIIATGLHQQANNQMSDARIKEMNVINIVNDVKENMMVNGGSSQPRTNVEVVSSARKISAVDKSKRDLHHFNENEYDIPAYIRNQGGNLKK